MPAHVTILPPVEVDDDAMDSVVEHLVAVAAKMRPFEVTLVGTGTFRPVSPVAFVCVVDGAEECRRLEEHVRSGVLGVDTRFEFHPHVTIARDVPDRELDRLQTELAGYRARMSISAFDLHEYLDGRWRLLRSFAFERVPT